MRSNRVLLTGAPVHFERYAPRHPRDLAGHRALQYADAPKGTSSRFRHARHGKSAQGMNTPLRTNNAQGMMPGLRAGPGRTGCRQSTMCDWPLEPIARHIVTPPGRRRPAPGALSCLSLPSVSYLRAAMCTARSSSALHS
jgi:hypothetical protein